MSKNTLENLFKNLENKFDFEEPNTNHNQRFLDKLNTKQESPKISKNRNLWKPLIGIAASIVLLISLFIFTNKGNTTPVLADISPEMAKTESIFMATLTNELSKINSEDMPEYQELIVDALFEIKLQEERYNQLIYGLKENPKDELILSAMILNFQSRIDILQEVMDQIEDLKKLENQTEIKTLKS